MEETFKELRIANIARQAEWPGNEEADAEFRALELADEIGEVLGATKKWLRAERGIAGNTKTIEDLADEIGDALISLDLLLNEVGLPELKPLHGASVSGSTCPARMALTVFASAGRTADVFIDIVSQRADSEVSHLLHRFKGSIYVLTLQIIRLAQNFEINVERAIASKFNKTSEKYGLQTRMWVAA